MKEYLNILTCLFLIVTGIALATVPRWFEIPGIVDPIVEKCYFVGQAASFSVFIILAIILCKNRIVGICLTYALIISLSNLMNELVGDPLHWHINDIFIGCIGLLYTNYRILKYCLTKINIKHKNHVNTLSGTSN